MNKNKCNFFIEHTDKQALEIIKHRFSFAPNISQRSPRSRDIGKKIKTTYILIISSKKDINNLIEFLDNKENVELQVRRKREPNSSITQILIHQRRGIYGYPPPRNSQILRPNKRKSV